MRASIGWLAVAGISCGPSTAADAGAAGDAGASTEVGGASDTGGRDPDPASTTAGAQDTGTSPTLCLSTRAIAIDIAGSAMAFADVDGDDRRELWREAIDLTAPGGRTSTLDAFLVDPDGNVHAIATQHAEARFIGFADIDADGRDDLLTALDVEGAQAWRHGETDATFASPQPISMPKDFSQSWLDVDGDGDADVFGSHDGFAAALVLYVGDGTGQFIGTSTLEFPLGAWITRVMPTPEPGVFIAESYNGADGFGAAASFWRLELGGDDAPSIVSGTPELSHQSMIAADDFDGDGVTDVLTQGNDAADAVQLWATTNGEWAARTLASDAHAVAGDFLGDGSVQVLLGNDGGELWLLPAPIAAEPTQVSVQGAFPTPSAVLDLDGDGRDEVISNGASGLAMHDIQPCE